MRSQGSFCPSIPNMTVGTNIISYTANNFIFFKINCQLAYSFILLFHIPIPYPILPPSIFLKYRCLCNYLSLIYCEPVEATYVTKPQYIYRVTYTIFLVISIIYTYIYVLLTIIITNLKYISNKWSFNHLYTIRL